MDLLENAFEMVRKYSLCDHCLGRQFALLGYNLENTKRGQALKLVLVLHSSKLFLDENPVGANDLKVLVENAFSSEAKQAV